MTEVPNARKVVSWGFEFGEERLSEVVLLGDYVAMLTISERNEWARELLIGNGRPLLDALRVAEARMKSDWGSKDNLEADVEAAVRLCLNRLALLHEYAEHWYTGVLAKRTLAARAGTVTNVPEATP